MKRSYKLTPLMDRSIEAAIEDLYSDLGFVLPNIFVTLQLVPICMAYVW